VLAIAASVRASALSRVQGKFRPSGIRLGFPPGPWATCNFFKVGGEKTVDLT
jgi:hypothetical protein